MPLYNVGDIIESGDSVFQPWAHLGPATMQFNESAVAGWVSQPVNAWTNIAYILMSVWVLLRFRKNGNRSLALFFSGAAAMVGVTSFLYHAQPFFFFQIFDLSSMYLISGFLLAKNTVRLTGISNRWTAPMTGMAIALSAGLLLVLRGKSGAMIFGLEVLMALTIELVIGIRARIRAQYLYLGLAFLTFLFSLAFWVLDYTHKLFSPDNHIIQGHGLWHIINSFCCPLLCEFYRQFGQRPSGLTTGRNR